MNTPLQKAAQAMIDRWESPDWKDTPHTAHYVDELRKALDAELAQSVEPEVLMVDAAMVEMKNIVPPLRRSECLRLIRAAINATAHPPQPQATTPAVPELLEELENCRDLLKTAFPDAPVDSCIWVGIIKASAAIAAAQGEKL